MKRLLPLLTIALLGAAVTASADNFYYGYYQNPALTYDPEDSKVSLAENTWNWYETDSVTYSNTSTIVRDTQRTTKLSSKNNFFRLEFDKNNVEVYLTDWVSELYDDTTNFNSSTEALFNTDIVKYGYRELTWNATEKKYDVGETHFYEIFDEEDPTKLNTENVKVIDTVTGDNGNKTNRYQYSFVGKTFGTGDVIELCLEDKNGNQVYSFSSYDADLDEFVPFNPTTGSDTPTALMPGGYNDGGYVIPKIETDEMLNLHYFPDREQWTPFDATDPTLAANKAMPLAQLIPLGGRAVSFGIYVVGRPLPGGLPIALVAGLFGLGFCYIRRRKAIAG